MAGESAPASHLPSDPWLLAARQFLVETGIEQRGLRTIVWAESSGSMPARMHLWENAQRLGFLPRWSIDNQRPSGESTRCGIPIERLSRAAFAEPSHWEAFIDPHPWGGPDRVCRICAEFDRHHQECVDVPVDILDSSDHELLAAARHNPSASSRALAECLLSIAESHAIRNARWARPDRRGDIAATAHMAANGQVVPLHAFRLALTATIDSNAEPEKPALVDLGCLAERAASIRPGTKGAVGRYLEIGLIRPALASMQQTGSRDLIGDVVQHVIDGRASQVPETLAGSRGVFARLRLDEAEPRLRVIARPHSQPRGRVAHAWIPRRLEAGDLRAACGADLTTSWMSSHFSGTTYESCTACRNVPAESYHQADSPDDSAVSSLAFQAAEKAVADRVGTETDLEWEIDLRKAVRTAYLDAFRGETARRLRAHGEDALHRLLGPGAYHRLSGRCGGPLAEALADDAWLELAALPAKQLAKFIESKTVASAPQGSGRGGAPSWEEHFERLSAYRSEHGQLPPQAWIEPDGMRLGGWLRNQRNAVRGHRHITEGHRALLDALDPNWMMPVQQVRTEHRDSYPPLRLVTDDDRG